VDARHLLFEQRGAAERSATRDEVTYDSKYLTKVQYCRLHQVDHHEPYLTSKEAVLQHPEGSTP